MSRLSLRKNHDLNQSNVQESISEMRWISLKDSGAVSALIVTKSVPKPPRHNTLQNGRSLNIQRS